jgi:hypothetical protein
MIERVIIVNDSIERGRIGRLGLEDKPLKLSASGVHTAGEKPQTFYCNGRRCLPFDEVDK